jgi:hypothetical protein
VKSNAPKNPVGDPTEAAIAKVLRAEREARQSIASAQLDAQAIAEQARASARALAERTERRIRSVVGAFENELSDRLADIDADAARIATPHVLSDSELGALGLAVTALARELTGARP